MGAHPLTTTDWLSDHLRDLDVRVLDASWYLPSDARDTRAEYSLEHIPGAEFFDIDAIADQQSSLPHMMPPSDRFAAAVQRILLLYMTRRAFTHRRGFGGRFMQWDIKTARYSMED